MNMKKIFEAMGSLLLYPEEEIAHRINSLRAKWGVDDADKHIRERIEGISKFVPSSEEDLPYTSAIAIVKLVRKLSRDIAAETNQPFKEIYSRLIERTRTSISQQGIEFMKAFYEHMKIIAPEFLPVSQAKKPVAQAQKIGDSFNCG